MIAQLFRFAVSGGLSTLLYGVFSIFLTYFTTWSVNGVHALSFLLCVPVSYLLQRSFTFRFDGTYTKSLIRFFMLMLTTFAISVVAVNVVDGLGYHRLVGVISVMVVVPITSYLAMQHWIFR